MNIDSTLKTLQLADIPDKGISIEKFRAANPKIVSASSRELINLILEVNFESEQGAFMLWQLVERERSVGKSKCLLVFYGKRLGLAIKITQYNSKWSTWFRATLETRNHIKYGDVLLLK